ncbi:Bromodomain-containing protein [Artemisia annua]|uniref:Bromodomain-containing protein n=1 Tax=Artemisia annua TaxID=35608 RepID=A0A2U1L4L7_ARTAN|nr:Bromodomain-containing protein [Artemisia annua]
MILQFINISLCYLTFYPQIVFPSLSLSPNHFPKSFSLTLTFYPQTVTVVTYHSHTHRSASPARHRRLGRAPTILRQQLTMSPPHSIAQSHRIHLSPSTSLCQKSVESALHSITATAASPHSITIGLNIVHYLEAVIDCCKISHIEKDHLVKLMKQLIINMAPSRGISRSTPPTVADVPTLLGTGAFSLLGCTQNEVKTDVKPLPAYLRWPHMQADQVRGIGLREIGGGFPKHHRAPFVKFACYAIAKPSTMVQKMQDIKRLRGHRDAVYCGMVTTFLANFPEVTLAGTFCTWGIGRGNKSAVHDTLNKLGTSHLYTSVSARNQSGANRRTSVANGSVGSVWVKWVMGQWVIRQTGHPLEMGQKGRVKQVGSGLPGLRLKHSYVVFIRASL